jgi:hypothetical protein
VSVFFSAFAREEMARDARAGVIASVIANVNRPRGRKPLTPGDFFASLERPASREVSVERMRSNVRSFFGLT